MSAKCVLEEECPIECGDNSHYDHCAFGCEPSCDDPFMIECRGLARSLAGECQPRCVCDSGYIKDENDECIPMEDCLSCGDNSAFEPCHDVCAPD